MQVSNSSALMSNDHNPPDLLIFNVPKGLRCSVHRKADSPALSQSRLSKLHILRLAPA